MKHGLFALALLCGWLLPACSPTPTPTDVATNDTTDQAKTATANLILTNARVYTLDWGEPAPDGTPAADAPYSRDAGWQPDAEAVVSQNGRIVYVGTTEQALTWRNERSELIDLDGATLLPGLVDSHTHVFELGALLERVNLTDVATEAEVVELVKQRAATIPAGEWIVGAGWDEGAWANRYPDKAALSAAVPDHPVFLRSLHGFAGWVNQKALDELGINASTVVPVGGDMLLGDDGQPTGVFLNRALELLDNGLPAPSAETRAGQVIKALEQMARDGYVTVHEAGVDAPDMRILERLEAQERLPIRVYAMLSLRDEDLIRDWLTKGPDADSDSMLVTRAVKAYYDGALGSRGARLLEDYSDKPGHRGVSGDGYGFNQELNAAAMEAGFQVGVHAIGDAGNREALDILEGMFRMTPSTAQQRHRIEHAQVLHPDDLPRFAELGIIASMEPPHAMEDKPWAEDRLGPERIRGAYAWRALRESGAHLTFNADNPGSDHNIFYGLHSAIAREDKDGEPAGGWYAQQAVRAEEAIRGYTSWSAYAAFREANTGVIATGRWADLTAMDIDPFVIGETNPGGLLNGNIQLTVVNGEVLYVGDE